MLILGLVPVAYAHTPFYWFGYINGLHDGKGGVYDSSTRGDYATQITNSTTDDNHCMAGYNDGFHKVCPNPHDGTCAPKTNQTSPPPPINYTAYNTLNHTQACALYREMHPLTEPMSGAFISCSWH
ncbi:MAG: hypothetical protein WAM14_08950 [Candidatus Nitrosopolaris sp.]